MPIRSKSLSPAQLEIMNIIWDRGEIGVAELWQTLSARRKVARNTVQTTVARLQDRGWLTHRQDGNAYYYRAAVPRQRAVGSLLKRLVESAFGGSTSGIILTLLQQESLTPEEAARIRTMIDEAEQRRRRHRTKEAL